MKRRNLLKQIGTMGIAAAIPVSKAKAADNPRVYPNGDSAFASGCWLTPSETEGPYYFNANLVREDIRTDVDTGEFHDGLPLRMTFIVVNQNCVPIPNVLVDIWHADKDGVYSGYVQPGGNTVGEDFMRGVQSTDGSGQCSFITSYPGWYPGRATHIHFKVRLSSTTYVTSQFAFLNEVNDSVYETPLYSGRGANPTTNGDDNIFGSDEPLHQIMDCVPNEETGGYDGTFTIGVDAPTSDLEDTSLTSNAPKILSNRPNPFSRETEISYYLPESASVRLTVYDVMGRRVAALEDGTRSAGTHTVVLDGSRLDNGFYLAKLVAGGAVDTRELLLVRR